MASENSRYRLNGTKAKALGAVYTPPRVAAAIVRWAVRFPTDSVLDPSCGEGVFLSAARTRLADLGNKRPLCVGVDIDGRVAAASGAVHADFFEWTITARQFDVIVGNPPFIRSHLFPEKSRQRAFYQMKGMGLKPSRLMSTWAPFIAISADLLRPGGRMAFVVPEELLQVSYARELREFLVSRFRRVIISFPIGNVFPSVQQSVVLLLCDNETEGPAGLSLISFSDLEEGPPYKIEPAPGWTWSKKWTHLFLSQPERDLLDEVFSQLPWKPFNEFGRVEVGVVTGDNGFFLLPAEKAHAVDGEYFEPILSRAADLKGISFSSDDFRELEEKGRPVYLLSTAEESDRLPQTLKDYLAQGEGRGTVDRFKCRQRKPWYAVPSVWPADAILLRQSDEIPRIIHLEGRYTTTDTIHRIRWRDKVMGKRHAVSFLNTWSLIACELTGRSYGGGVLELMPSEANRIPMPEPINELEDIFPRVDTLVRKRKYLEAVELVDAVVSPHFIPPPQIDNSREVLLKLMKRRRERKNGRRD